MTNEEAQALTRKTLNSSEERKKLYEQSVQKIEKTIQYEASRGYFFWDTFVGINDGFPVGLSRGLFGEEYLRFISKVFREKGFKVEIKDHTPLISTLTISWYEPKPEEPSEQNWLKRLWAKISQ